MAASVNDNLDQTTSSATGRPVTATLSAPGHSIGGTSIGVSVATNWSTTTGIHFSIYATTTVGSLTVKDTSTQTDWKGTLSGTTISNMTITGGTDQDYSAGAIVEITPTARWAKDLYDWAIAQHKQDGTHANTITTDTINENTAANGVTIDGLNIKDSKLNTNNSVVTANITDDAVTPAKWTNPYCFSAWASGGTTISDGAWTKIALATEEYDYNSNFASSTYTAPVAGVYHFDGSWQVGSISTGTLFASSVYKNGALFKQTNTPPLSNGASGIHCDILLAANDTVEFYAFQESAGTEAVITVQESTWFSGHLVHAV